MSASAHGLERPKPLAEDKPSSSLRSLPTSRSENPILLLNPMNLPPSRSPSPSPKRKLVWEEDDDPEETEALQNVLSMDADEERLGNGKEDAHDEDMESDANPIRKSPDSFLLRTPPRHSPRRKLQWGDDSGTDRNEQEPDRYRSDRSSHSVKDKEEAGRAKRMMHVERETQETGNAKAPNMWKLVASYPTDALSLNTTSSGESSSSSSSPSPNALFSPTLCSSPVRSRFYSDFVSQQPRSRSKHAAGNVSKACVSEWLAITQSPEFIYQAFPSSYPAPYTNIPLYPRTQTRLEKFISKRPADLLIWHWLRKLVLGILYKNDESKRIQLLDRALVRIFEMRPDMDNTTGSIQCVERQQKVDTVLQVDTLYPANMSAREKLDRLWQLDLDMYTNLRILHALGLMHGDLKMDNIGYVQGHYKLLDLDGMVPTTGSELERATLARIQSVRNDPSTPSELKKTWDAFQHTLDDLTLRFGDVAPETVWDTHLFRQFRNGSNLAPEANETFDWSARYPRTHEMDLFSWGCILLHVYTQGKYKYETIRSELHVDTALAKVLKEAHLNWTEQYEREHHRSTSLSASDFLFSRKLDQFEWRIQTLLDTNPNKRLAYRMERRVLDVPFDPNDLGSI